MFFLMVHTINLKATVVLLNILLLPTTQIQLFQFQK